MSFDWVLHIGMRGEGGLQINVIKKEALAVINALRDICRIGGLH